MREPDRPEAARAGDRYDGTLLEEAIRIQSITAEITALEDPEAIPARVVEALAEALDIRVASVVLRDPETGVLRYAAEHGVPEAAKAMGFRPGGTADQVLQSGEALFVEDASRDPRVHAGARRLFQAWACLPIRHRAQVFGLLFVNFDTPHAFPPLERHILRIFASQTAIALENARLQRSLRQQASALAFLAALGRDLSSSLDAQDTVRVVHRALLGHLPTTAAGYLWRVEESALHPVLASGVEPAALPVLGLDLLRRPDFPRGTAPLSGPDLRALLELPEGLAPEESRGLVLALRAGEEIQGLLALVAPAASPLFAPSELDFLQALADRVALALHNATLYARTLQASRRDSLTQLLNHGTFQARLAEAVPAGSTPACLLMIDADHFKRCNDTHGHAFGDRVLVALARTIREQVRPTDPVGRWGGEEFAVLLPGVDLDGGRRVAERIRAAMERLVVVHPDGRDLPAPTVSIGLSAHPECDATLERLVESADAALYRAKAGGRNRVRTAADPPGT